MKYIIKDKFEGLENAAYAVIKDVKVKGNVPELEKLKQEVLERVLKYSDEEIENNPIVLGYKKVFNKFNDENFSPAGYNLVKLIRSRNSFPTINSAVDAYNIVVAESFLSFGAHDLDKVGGDISLEIADQDYLIKAVNKDEDLEIKKGLYILKSVANDEPISALGNKDNNFYKIKVKSKTLFLTEDGNPNTTPEFVLENLKKACELIIKYCGGSYEIFSVLTGEKKAEGSNSEFGKNNAQPKVEKKFIYEDEVLMKLQETVHEAFISQFNELEISKEDIQIEFPKDPTHGDYASNVALKLSGQLKLAPLMIAQKIVDQINTSEDKGLVQEVSAAMPGFINIKLNPNYSKDQLLEILKLGEDYGKSKLGEGKKVMIEFGQPNTHKAFHIGHLKSAVSGLSMVRLHEALGYEVVKANYFGDVGMHVARSTWAFMKKGEPENFSSLTVHEQMAYIDDCYVYGSKMFKESPEAQAEMRDINKKIYSMYHLKDNENIEDKEFAVYARLRKISILHQTDVWKKLGVVFDREYPEGEVFPIAKELINKYKGEIFELHDGAWIYRGEKDGLKTWVFETKDGNPTYSGKDLGLGVKKYEEYKLDTSIYTTSVEQIDYFKAVFACLEKIMPETKGKNIHVPFGWMLMNNKKVSSKTGNTVKGMDILDMAYKLAEEKISETKEYTDEMRKDIVDAVAIAGLKFLILSHEFHKNINYDPDSFIQLDGFSGPYILYSYARSRAILRKAGVEGEIDSNRFNELEMSALLENEQEQALIKQLMKYSSEVKSAGEKIAPHIIANYLYELAQAFNGFYRECQVVEAEDSVRESRLLLVEATGIVMKSGLGLLGIDTVEVM